MLIKVNKQIEALKVSETKTAEEAEKLETEKKEIIDNINYVKFFPKTYKYLSLFPKNDTDNMNTKFKIHKIRQKIKMHLQGTERHKGDIKKNEMQNNNGQVVVDYEMEVNNRGWKGKEEDKDDFFLYE